METLLGVASAQGGLLTSTFCIHGFVGGFCWIVSASGQASSKGAHDGIDVCCCGGREVFTRRYSFFSRLVRDCLLPSCVAGDFARTNVLRASL